MTKMHTVVTHITTEEEHDSSMNKEVQLDYTPAIPDTHMMHFSQNTKVVCGMLTKIIIVGFFYSLL